MSYKDEFNEWANNFYWETGRDPSLNDSELFRTQWVDDVCSYADELKDTAKYEVTR